MTDYDPDECKRLIAETREDDERMTKAPWGLDDSELDAIARLRNNARPLADQLEAAVMEVVRFVMERDEERTTNDALTAQIAKLTEELDAMLAVAEAAVKWAPSVRTSVMHARSPQVEVNLYRAVNAYRAAKEKP